MAIDTHTILPRLLTTRPLADATILEAKKRGVEISTLSFIDTAPIHTAEIIEEIQAALLMSTTVVFTSMNAVESVVEIMQDQQPDWQIYCIGQTTKSLIEKYFGEDRIIGTADNAVALADRIIEDELSDEVVFFCGDQRRPELPDMLFAAGILVTEIVVYETIPIHHKLNESIAGVLFYSPSAVESFFVNNKLEPRTLVFAIGDTTATTIRKFCSNKIILADKPGKEGLAKKAIDILALN
ncbi:MAG: uroporphyrinogen-III synthase [Flavipsychrobacter sp.]|nr:uroporphyrinogen-III synthase [Flavipsychrobacter sp.]